MLELPDVYNQTLRFLLIATLLHSIRRHNLLLMQAATVGLLFSVHVKFRSISATSVLSTGAMY